MKRIQYLLWLMLCMFCTVNLLTACGGDETESGTTGGEETVTLKLLSVSPSSGTTVDAGNVEVVFTFNQEIFLVNPNKITLNGQTATHVTVSARTLTCNITLSQGTENVVKIEKGAIRVTGTPTLNTEEYSTTLNVAAAETPIVTPTKSAEAEKLLQYMRENTGKKMLSGTMANVNWNQNEALWVYKHTGKYPAINDNGQTHLARSMSGHYSICYCSSRNSLTLPLTCLNHRNSYYEFL